MSQQVINGPRYKKTQENMSLADWLALQRKGQATGARPGAKPPPKPSNNQPRPTRKAPQKKPPPKPKPKPKPVTPSESEESEEESPPATPTKGLDDIKAEFDRLDPETKRKAREEMQTLLKWATNGKNNDMYKAKEILFRE